MRIFRTIPLLIFAMILASAPTFAAKKSAPPRKADKPATAVASTSKTSPLANRIDAALSGIDGVWGVEVRSLETGEELYSRNADRLFTPASNVKLFTVASALTLLGDETRARTTVECTPAALSGNVINGDLILVGRGDASLTRADIEALATQVAARGVKQIAGDIIGDDSWFGWEETHDYWTVGDLTWDFGALTSALSVDDNIVTVRVAPGEQAGDAAVVDVLPLGDLFTIDNHARTVAHDDAAHAKKELSLHREPGSRTISVWGWLPMGEKETSLHIAAADPAEMAAKILIAALRAQGVEVVGRARARHASRAEAAMQGVESAPSARLTLATHAGPTVLDEARIADKMSQNLHAELLLRRMGRADVGPSATGSLAAGLAAEKSVFAKAGVDDKELYLADGSGLARADLASPTAVVKMLAWAAQQSWGGAYTDTLPVAGVDGTLAHRAQTVGELRAKTGSFLHVNALSGYATTAAGARIVFSIMVNNHRMGARGGSEAIDKVVAAMLNDAEGETTKGHASAAQPSKKSAPAKKKAQR